MTDNEIKALKELESWQKLAYHNDDGTDEDSHNLYEALTCIFDLINRLQAKVIKEQNKNSKLRNERNRLQAENERLQEAIDEQDIEISRLYKRIDEAQAEAINKFAEQVKMAFYYEFDELIPSVMADKIDNISEEIIKAITKEGCKPIPHSLSQYGSGTEVLYRCANCGTDFRILGKYETYCHGCGVKQDWENSLIYCSEQFKEMYNELVYKKHAYIQGNRNIDKELKQLLYRFYEGEIK